MNDINKHTVALLKTTKTSKMALDKIYRRLMTPSKVCPSDMVQFIEW